ncbi:hypothetical protein, partial [Escherichia coli]|uniref:hypothetical protein n=1 Tax=Escherichia coli TaxID=562 RepID=UPI001BFEC496
TNHLQSGFVVQKVGEKPADQVVWMCCFFVLGNAQKTRILGGRSRARSLYLYYRQQLKDVLFWLSPVVARL